MSSNNPETWFDICALDDITPNTGVGACVDGQLIALFRLGNEGRVYALSNTDPFSQANVMSRGIVGDIQGECVVASPIYKQHFSLETGRCLEDHEKKLLVYPVKTEGGRVLVSSEPKKTYVTYQKPQQEKMKLVLVGNGLAGMRCLEDLLDMAPDRYDITVIGEEPWGNYNRIMLSPVLSGEKSIEDIMLHPPQWYVDKGIRFLSNDPAVHIDRTARRVLTRSGCAVDYDRIILATGSRPFVPPVPGNDLRGVLSFRDIYDVKRMIEYSQSHKHAVVIGGGLLGLEAAWGLKRRGMQVTVLHLAHCLMNNQLDERAGQLLRASIENSGIDVITSAVTEEIRGKDGRVSSVLLHDGRLLEADLVVFAAGIRPNTSLAEKSGLRCNRGVIVNDTMQTWDPAIYAVGECIEHRGETFGLVEPLWGQAFICAAHLAERGSLTFKARPVATQLKVTGVDVFSAGDFDPKEGDYEDIILNDEKRNIYKRIIIRQDKVIGAVLFGDTEDGSWYAELISDQTSVSSFRHKMLFGRDFALKNRAA